MNSRRILSTLRTPKMVDVLSAWRQRKGIVLLSAVMLMIAITSCTFKAMDDNSNEQSISQSYITISAELDMPRIPSVRGLRATNSEGSWTPHNGTSDQPILTPDGVGRENEYVVSSIRILLFDNNNGGDRYIPEGGSLVFKTSDNTLPNPGVVSSDASHSNLSRSFTFPPIRVPKGSYHIVLVANASNNMADRIDNPSNPDYVRTIADLESFVFDLYDYVQDRVFNGGELNALVTVGYGFPMVGELSVALARGGGSPQQPEQIGSIGIKRAISFIRMVLTNKDVHGNQFPGTDKWKIYQIGLVNAARNSHLMERVNSPLGLGSLEYYKNNGSEREFLDIATWGEPGPNGIGHFDNGLPAEFNYEVYACEKLGITASADYLYYKIVMQHDVTHNTKTYMVPIYSESNGVKDYNIYRNTQYTITAYFKGGELETTVKVVPWSSGGEITKEVKSNQYVSE